MTAEGGPLIVIGAPSRPSLVLWISSKYCAWENTDIRTDTHEEEERGGRGGLYDSRHQHLLVVKFKNRSLSPFTGRIKCTSKY